MMPRLARSCCLVQMFCPGLAGPGPPGFAMSTTASAMTGGAEEQSLGGSGGAHADARHRVPGPTRPATHPALAPECKKEERSVARSFPKKQNLEGEDSND